MASVGERLRHERETRSTTIEDVAAASGIGQSYLESLERDEIHELPGPAFGKLYIRAYAEVLGFDPQPWIDDYDREQRMIRGASTDPTPAAPAELRPVAAAIARWKEARTAPDTAERAAERAVEAVVPEHESPAEDTPVDVVIPETIERVPTAKRFVAPLLLVGVVAIALAIYLGMRGTGGGQPPAIVAAQAPVTPEPQAPPPVRARVIRPAPAPTPAHAPGALTVPESGVGRRVVNSRLEGESASFIAGEVAWFQTRVLGGKRGETIRHVWIYEGRAQQSITLRVGAPDWRTQSSKTLYRSGPWTVEARDGNGRVLAAAAFTCVPERVILRAR